ncbi:hypothetical protein K470DRAFT_262450 [Piedraia hortae CBS 480.64]|uniref:Cwf19-like C-terminal domain-containing protein n=1 Tax=Piedraia hortae CBS 480.64 TaxID=1314780 RepID=A0A6A7C693_9PEZI|nr:hypothetical protein K470DRAFT_262450 [Piedraia hortae CBS 480.64]
MATYPKIIVLTNNSTLAFLFEKLTILHTKQKFTFAVILNLFPPSTAPEIPALLSGKIPYPAGLPIYFTQGSTELPSQLAQHLASHPDGEIVEGITFLGQRGSITTLEGTAIAALGGTCASEGECETKNDANGNASAADKETHHPNAAKKVPYAPTDLPPLTTKYPHGVDILLTHDWPEGVAQASTLPSPEGYTPSPLIAKLTKALQPRYHFSVSKCFYEREPFSYPPPSERITRFISLSTTTQKSMYAFVLKPPTVTPKCTPNPFTQQALKRSMPPPPPPPPSKRPRRAPKPKQKECFLCLSTTPTPHLIISIAEHAYLSLPRGPLLTRDYLPIPGHVMIIPLDHTPLCPEGEALREMRKYQEAVVGMLREKNLGAVGWEISRLGGVHFHVQVVGLPAGVAGCVGEAFVEKGREMGYCGFVKDGLEGEVLRVFIWDEGGGCEEMEMGLGEGFDVRFPRRVVAGLLGLDGRSEWRDVVQSLEEEEKDARVLRGGFGRWDFGG